MRTTIELKKEIIAKYENGFQVSDLALQYGMAKSTISTFLKNMDIIKKADVAKEVTLQADVANQRKEKEKNPEGELSLFRF